MTTCDICPRCRTTARPGEPVCAMCGWVFDQTQPMPAAPTPPNPVHVQPASPRPLTPAHRICPICGAKAAMTATSCKQCGHYYPNLWWLIASAIAMALFVMAVKLVTGY